MVNGVVTIPLPGPQLSPPRELNPGPVHASAPIDFAPADFVIGPENRLAAVAAKAFFEKRALRYSPLIVYGPSGSGKSHLARGLALWWRKKHPSARVVLTSGAEFARDFAQALERRQLTAWRGEQRGADLLVLEDIGQLAGKGPAQLELLHTLDELAARDAIVLVTARALPQQTTTLLAGLRSRLSAGLAVPLALPGPGARRTILERLAESRGLALPKGALQSLSGGPNVSVPALYGAILQLELVVRSGGVDAQQLRRLAAEHPRPEAPSLRTIAGAAAKYFGLKLSDLKSSSRRQAVVAARGVAIYLARLLTEHSLEQIGAYFGGRDHTTVLHGHRRTEKLMKRDPATRHAIAELKKTLVA